MLTHKLQMYQRLGLSRSKFRAIEIFSRAIPRQEDKITCQKDPSENFI